MSRGQQVSVGVVGQDQDQVQALSHAVVSHGYGLGVACTGADLAAHVPQARVDVWMANLPDDADDDIDLLLTTGSPVLFGIEKAPSLNTIERIIWERRVYLKLRNTVGEPALDSGLDELDQTPPPAQPLAVPASLHAAASTPCLVGVLAASLGGPAAVKAFLDRLPAELPISFILAQHIDKRMLSVLPHVLGRHNAWQIKVAEAGDVLTQGQVFIAPVEQEIDFSAQGEILPLSRPWDGPYAPSIDQVLGNVARRFGRRSMAVIFSGMGADGSLTGPQLVERGGVIFAQTAESSACSSQPDAMRATGCVRASGSPEAMAAWVLEHLQSLQQQGEALGAPTA